ncbi:hypothetical protein FKM82_024203 [Ascaphus truei]
MFHRMSLNVLCPVEATTSNTRQRHNRRSLNATVKMFSPFIVKVLLHFQPPPPLFYRGHSSRFCLSLHQVQTRDVSLFSP